MMGMKRSALPLGARPVRPWAQVADLQRAAAARDCVRERTVPGLTATRTGPSPAGDDELMLDQLPISASNSGRTSPRTTGERRATTPSGLSQLLQAIARTGVVRISPGARSTPGSRESA